LTVCFQAGQNLPGQGILDTLCFIQNDQIRKYAESQPILPWNNSNKRRKRECTY
jgi:hypothetical protein